MNQQCKVCGEPAAGFHFGAFTCEGCKSFFGRTYNNLNSISACKNNGECVINKKNRTSCKACRLRKCFLVGMSKSGSRYGRRSNWFKIHCLLQEQQQQNPNSLAAPTTLFNGNYGLYPPAFLTNHPSIYPERLLASPSVNGYQPTSKKVKQVDAQRGGSNSEDSGGSSGDNEDDSTRPASVLSFRPPSQQSPSPFSESEFSVTQKKMSPSLNLQQPSSPLGSCGSSSRQFPSPIGHARTSPSLPRLFYHGIVPPFSTPVTRPELAPFDGNFLFVNRLAGIPQPRAGGDLIPYSPALAGTAVEQEQPIDLSVKSSKCGKQSDADTDDQQLEPSPKNSSSHAPSPLDLTNKRPIEVPITG